MEMCSQLRHFVYIFVCSIFIVSSSTDQVHFHQLKHCSVQAHCPDNSTCTKVENNFNCICWHGYFQNPNWTENVVAGKKSDYCTRNAMNKTVVIYQRLPPSGKHLAVAISLILVGVIIVTLLFYCFGIIRPIKRTQAAYRRMQLRRKHHRRLVEFDDIDMTFRDTRNAEQIS